MLTSIKKITIKVLFIIFLLINISTKAYAVVQPTSNFYVNDYANLLSADTENYIITINQSLQKQSGAQIVVVTIPSLNGQSLEEYATELFRSFGIGDKTKNNGLLLLLALEERQFRVEVGYGLEGILPDAKTGRIQDEYIIPYLRENRWDEGVRNGFNAFLDVITNEYNITIEKESAKIVGTSSISLDNANRNTRIIFTSMMISCILGISIRFKKKLSTKIKWIIVLIYLAIIAIIMYISTKIIMLSIMFAFFNGIVLLSAIFGRGMYIGGIGRRIPEEDLLEDSTVVEVFTAEEDLLAVEVALEVFKKYKE